MGSVLVLDNASVHVGAESTEAIYTLCEQAGVQLCFLPTYSPELNAAELVFQTSKQMVSQNRSMEREHLSLDLLAVLGRISKSMMLSFYQRVLTGWMKSLDPALVQS